MHHARPSSKPAVAVIALLSALAAGGCGSPGSTFDKMNAPAVYEGPGCYDHKNRIERTVKSKAECDALTWVWKP